MGIILDIIIIALMAISIFFGYKRGLVKVAVKLCALLIAIIVTLIFYQPVTNIIISNTQLDEKIENIIIENGTKELEESNEENKNFVDSMQQYVDTTITNAQNEIVESAAKEVAVRIINILVIVGLFIVTRIALTLLVFISGIITNLPIIKQFNELGGALYGIIRGLALIYLILAVVFLVVSMSANNSIVTIMDSSIVTKFMYENNILLNIIF